MEKYIRVDWPESQKWMEFEYAGQGVVLAQDMTAFVPEELYNESHMVRDPIKDGLWEAIHMIRQATKRDDVTNLDRRVLEGLLLDLYGKLLSLALDNI